MVQKGARDPSALTEDELRALRRIETDLHDPTSLASSTTSTSPEVGLRAVVALRRLLEDVEATQVANARRHGWSWTDIADVLEITRQSAHAKFRETQGADR
jgi:hypothetical protein